MGQLHDRMEQNHKLKNVSPAARYIHLLYVRKSVARYRPDRQRSWASATQPSSPRGMPVTAFPLTGR